MEINSLLNVNAPLAVSSMINPASLPQSIRQSDQRKQEDNASVKLNLSQAAQNMLSSQQDVMGNKPVPETTKQEGNPSDDPDQKSRDSEEERKDSRS